MKNLTFALSLFIPTLIFSQVQFTAGPVLEKNRNASIYKILDADENYFYSYRIRTKGKGTSYYIEKYDKKKLEPVFTKEITIDQGDGLNRMVNVFYAQGIIYFFYFSYSGEAKKTSLKYQTLSASGQISDKVSIITSISTETFEYPSFELPNFEIFQNPAKTKFLIKSCHRFNRESPYFTDFILVNCQEGLKQVWTKTTRQYLINANEFINIVTALHPNFEKTNFLGLLFDDNDNIYYGFLEAYKGSAENGGAQLLHFACLAAKDEEPKIIELSFEDNYLIDNIAFLKTQNNEIMVAGYVKQPAEKKGKNLPKPGVFSFSINLNTNTIVSKTMQLFDEKMMDALETDSKFSKYYKYKLDHIFPIGNSFYFVGEQYIEQWKIVTQNGAPTVMSNFNYDYMDVIIAKLSASGKFDWVKNVPLRNERTLGITHVYKQYIAVNNEQFLYVLYNDHPKNLTLSEKENYNPSNLRSIKDMPGSNFVSGQINLQTGAIKRSLIFENDDNCFGPLEFTTQGFIPPSETEIFVPGNNNELYILAEGKEREQVRKLKLK